MRAEIIPYEPDTVSTGEGIVSSDNTLYISPACKHVSLGYTLLYYIPIINIERHDYYS